MTAVSDNVASGESWEETSWEETADEVVEENVDGVEDPDC